MYRLTKEGERYLREGLPEKKLVEIAKKNPVLQEAKKQLENFRFAVQWAKKNGWIKIDAGKIKILKQPTFIPEEIALKAINEKKGIDPVTLKILLRRNLVEEDRQDIYAMAENQLYQNRNMLTPELLKTGLWKKLDLKPYNVKASGKIIYPGKHHPYNMFLSEVRQKLVEMGFKEMTGPLIELEFWNFDALYQAQNHPSRDWSQTYSLKHPKKGILPKTLVGNVKSTHESGWKTGSLGWGYKWSRNKASQLMPRAHTTACSARQLAKGIEIPGKYFALSRCFRPDVIDATHGVEFNHCDGIIIDPDLKFKHLLGLLKTFALEFAGAEKVKFLPDYYPFTEPSCELSAKHPKLGWIELAGAGTFRPEVTQPLGVKDPVLAWGLGVDRLAMFKLNLKDIRELFTRDLSWLRKQVI